MYIQSSDQLRAKASLKEKHQGSLSSLKLLSGRGLCPSEGVSCALLPCWRQDFPPTATSPRLSNVKCFPLGLVSACLSIRLLSITSLLLKLTGDPHHFHFISSSYLLSVHSITQTPSPLLSENIIVLAAWQHLQYSKSKICLQPLNFMRSKPLVLQLILPSLQTPPV